MECTNYLFFARKLEQDSVTIDKYVKFYSNNNLKQQMLIFCEGTFFNDKKKRFSDSYAEKNSLDKFDYVLHPRTSGTTRIVKQVQNEFKKSGKELYSTVLDVTLAHRGFPCSIE